MKKNYPILFTSAFAALALAVACRKSISASPEISPSQVATTTIPVIKNFQCSSSPNYGDSLIYLQPSNNDYIIKPVNQVTLGQGKYLSWPTGLIIDSTTGSIDVSKSETGMRYIVGFVKKGTTDTCLQNLILAGITYVDSVYVLSNNDTLAIPFFNANAAAAAVCNAGNNNGDDDKPDGDDKCVFDGKDKKGKKGQAKDKNVNVSAVNGVINLKRTLQGGAFGANPSNGASILVPIYYSLNDKSKKAIQVINVDLRFYNKRSDIPVSVLNEIQYNRTSFYQNTPILSLAPRPPVIVVTNFL